MNHKQELILTDSAVDFLKEEIGEGTTVIANPTLAGTEANLTGLQVGNTKYKVPQGGAIEIVDVVSEGSGTVTQEQLTKLQNGAILRCNGNVIYSYLSEADGYLSFGGALRPATDGNSMLAPIIKINETTLEYSSTMFIISVTPYPPIGE